VKFVLRLLAIFVCWIFVLFTASLVMFPKAEMTAVVPDSEPMKWVYGLVVGLSTLAAMIAFAELIHRDGKEQ